MSYCESSIWVRRTWACASTSIRRRWSGTVSWSFRRRRILWFRLWRRNCDALGCTRFRSCVRRIVRVCKSQRTCWSDLTTGKWKDQLGPTRSHDEMSCMLSLLMLPCIEIYECFHHPFIQPTRSLFSFTLQTSHSYTPLNSSPSASIVHEAETSLAKESPTNITNKA